MHAIIVAFTDAKHKAALSKYAVDSLIVYASAVVIFGLQCGLKNGDAISQSRTVLGETVFIDKFRQPVQLFFDENRFNERSNEAAIDFREFAVNSFRWPIYHASIR